MNEKVQLWIIIGILLAWYFGTFVDSWNLKEIKKELRAIHKTLKKSESGAVYNEIRALHENLVHGDFYLCSKKCGGK